LKADLDTGLAFTFLFNSWVWSFGYLCSFVLQASTLHTSYSVYPIYERPTAKTGVHPKSQPEINGNRQDAIHLPFARPPLGLPTNTEAHSRILVYVLGTPLLLIDDPTNLRRLPSYACKRKSFAPGLDLTASLPDPRARRDRQLIARMLLFRERGTGRLRPGGGGGREGQARRLI
jgi:hypothetical protein